MLPSRKMQRIKTEGPTLEASVNRDSSRLSRSRHSRPNIDWHRFNVVQPLRELQPPQPLPLTELTGAQIRARHYLMKYKLLNDPQISFCLVNVILEERERMLQQPTQSPETGGSGSFLKPVLEQDNLTFKNGRHQGRQEVSDLAKWLDTKLQSLRNQEQITINDIVEYKQTVLNLGLGEIIRMVGSSCKQRAALLKSIWQATFQILQNAIVLLSKHIDKREEEKIKDDVELASLYQNLLKNEKQSAERLKKEYETILQHFRNLIVSTRSLKKEHKGLQLKNRLLEYSMESYKEGYTVALQMALQSGNANIVNWARKVLSKLIREKHRRKKNFKKAEADQHMYCHAKDIVFEWLRRTCQDFDVSQLSQFDKVDFMDQYRVEDTHKNKIRTLRRVDKQNQQLRDEKKLSISIAQGENKKQMQMKDFQERQQAAMAFLEQDSEDNMEIYEYFKTHSASTSMDIFYADCCTGQSIQSSTVSTQTESETYVEFGMMTDEMPKNRIRIGTFMNKISSINESNQAAGDLQSESILSGSTQKKKSTKKKKQVHYDMDYNVERKTKRGLTMSMNGKKNVVTVRNRKYKSKLTSLKDFDEPVYRVGSTAFIASEIENRGQRILTRQLELNKFQEVFEGMREEMEKNRPQFIQNIAQRRSFTNLNDVDYGCYKNYQEASQTRWAALRQKINRGMNNFIVNEFQEINRRIRQLLQKIPQQPNTMKKKVFRQNTQTFNGVSDGLRGVTIIRGQKASATLNTLNKILSSLIVDYVRQVKREKDGGIERLQKPFYPLNALYVDKFAHIYGLKEMAQKNMGSTLKNIMSLTHFSQKMKLFATLLGVYDHNIGGDELQLYIRCLVYLDNTGKVSLQIKQFNIDKLATDANMVRQNLERVLEGLPLRADMLIDEICQMFGSEEPSIEYICLHLLECLRQVKSGRLFGYLPLHGYLANSRSFLLSLVELLRILHLMPEKEKQIVKNFLQAADLQDETLRCITPQRFVSTCCRVNFPTIIDMLQLLNNNLNQYALDESAQKIVMAQLTADSLVWLDKVSKLWNISLQPGIIDELNNSLVYADEHLGEFWWRLAVCSLLDRKIQSHTNDILGRLGMFSIEQYFLEIRRPK